LGRNTANTMGSGNFPHADELIVERDMAAEQADNA
jgi:hypothetical protein